VPISEPAPVADPVASSTDPVAAAPTSEPGAQPIPESVAGLGAALASEPAHSTAADSLAATAAQFAEDVVERVPDVVKALISAEGASKAVRELIEQVGDLVSALLGGNGASRLAEGLIEQVANVVGDLAQALGGMLSGQLGGNDRVPAPSQGLVGGVAGVVGDLTRALGEALGMVLGVAPAPADDYYPAAQPLAAFYYDYEQATTGLIERSAAAVDELTQAAGGALSGSGGLAPNQEEGSVPATPPAAPLPVPPVAPPVTPVGYSSSSFVAGSATDAFQLLFAVLALFSVALLQGGRLSWLRRESHGPPTAVVLAIERPG